MSSRSSRESRQRKTWSLNLDLNLAPPSVDNNYVVDPNEEDDDDDVVELSPTAFAQVQSSLRLIFKFSFLSKRKRSKEF